MTIQTAISTFRGHRTPRFPIIQRRRVWALLSGSVILISLVGFAVRGINYSIDFTGGTQLVLDDPAGASVADVRDVLAKAPYDRADAEVQLVGGSRISIRTTALTDLTADQRTALIADLATVTGVTPDDVNQQVVGPTWGSQISRQALIGLVIVLIAISLYITVRFEWKMAVGAMVALVHDLIITAGVYAVIGREVAPATVIALLTILGFSLYDTVVVFDKVRENTKGLTSGSRMTYSDAANLALNQTLVRSINTSVVALLPVLSILVVGVILLGAGTLNDLALALFVGMLVGTYSSIFVATPFLAQIKERQPDIKALRKRVTQRRSAGGGQTVAVGTSAVVTSAGPRQQRVRRPRSQR